MTRSAKFHGSGERGKVRSKTRGGCLAQYYNFLFCSVAYRPFGQLTFELWWHLPTQDANKTLNVPVVSRLESFQSDSGRGSPANASIRFLSTTPQPSTSSSLPFRSRAKTLASLGSASRNNSKKDRSPREFKLPHDPFVNGQPIEVFLYKDAAERPICCLYYPPYLNITRFCEQAICSECFVQIKRPDPHPSEHNGPDLNAPPISEEERLAQAEGLLVSEVATCPYCKTPAFRHHICTSPVPPGIDMRVWRSAIWSDVCKV